ncbi:uncharacterized protein LOC128455620 [Scomber scombrus]|uniref:Uncharacterized protein LOC128455620 n=1 Tax=Scomber scombrus TaxID=13677 RepID=A0AAV1PEF0_SCOSC
MSEFELAPESDEERVSDDDMKQHCTEAQPQTTEGTEADNPTTSQEPQRGQSVRKLTEKGQELHDEQVRKVAHRFSVSYEKWKTIIKDAKERKRVLEAEESERKRVLEAKRRQIERMDTLKNLKASKARLQVYEQYEGSDEEVEALLHQHVPLKEERKEVKQNVTCQSITLNHKLCHF